MGKLDKYEALGFFNI